LVEKKDFDQQKQQPFQTQIQDKKGKPRLVIEG